MSDLADPLPTMAAIIPFPDGRRPRAVPPVVECGRILLFTGVRYERIAEPVAAPDRAGPSEPTLPVRQPRRRRSGGAAGLKRQS